MPQASFSTSVVLVSGAASGIWREVASFERAAITNPQKAAKLIIDAVVKKKERLVIGNDGKALDLITRLFPVRYTKILKSQIERAFTNPYKE